MEKDIKKEISGETDMDKLNRFLITVANTENVGIRRKILMLKKFIEVIEG